MHRNSQNLGQNFTQLHSDEDEQKIARVIQIKLTWWAMLMLKQYNEHFNFSTQAHLYKSWSWSLFPEKFILNTFVKINNS